MTVGPAASGLPGSELAHAAESVFGDRLGAAVRYAAMLAGDGTTRGLVGPREVDRLWDRHLLNCAVIAELIPLDASVADVGSGAGLPGIPLALARPDLRVELIEPMDRRTGFLNEVIAELALDNVTVLRGRAENAQRDRYDIVAARAVAPLYQLVPMALPLARLGGVLLALKGASAASELATARSAIADAGGGRGDVLTVGKGVVDPPTRVVVIRRELEQPLASRGHRSGRRG